MTVERVPHSPGELLRLRITNDAPIRFTLNQINADAWGRLQPLLSRQLRDVMRNLGNLLQQNSDPRKLDFALKEISPQSHLGSGTWALKLLTAAGLIVYTAHGPLGVSIEILWLPLAEKLRAL